LQRQFTVTRPNKAWVTDITDIRTWQGRLYLAVVMDLLSRAIVGWPAGPTLHRELVLHAVLAAVRRRRPRGTLVQSDQGTQDGCDACQRLGVRLLAHARMVLNDQLVGHVRGAVERGQHGAGSLSSSQWNRDSYRETLLSGRQYAVKIKKMFVKSQGD
jgi:hypothetical protein